jgi:tetratricopeptide (TPR) repeat protein
MWSQAIASVERAYVVQGENGYLPEQALNLYNLGMIRTTIGDHGQALSDLRTSLTLSQHLGDEYIGACATIGLLRLAIIQSRYEDAAAYAESAGQLLASAGNEEAIQLRWLWALLHSARGSPQLGLECAAQALDMARATGQLEQERESLRVLGSMRACCGEYTPAEALLREAIDLCRKQSDAYRQGLALLELGQLYERMSKAGQSGQVEAQALGAYDEAVQLFERLGAIYDLRIAQEARERAHAGLAQARAARAAAA